MDAKVEKERRAVATLKAHAWAAPLVAQAGARLQTEGFLFELRFAHEIARGGATAKYEQKTEGQSSVDFRLESEQGIWNIELVTVETSAAVEDATVRESRHGIAAETITLGRGLARADDAPLTAKQCPESELLRVMAKLEAKIVDPEGRPIKFPIPKEGTFNMLLIDMRHFEGHGFPDRDHCRQIFDGPRLVQYAQNVMFHPDGAPICGLWNEGNVRPAAQIARERLNVLGFVHEEVFSDDEIREVTVLFGNPRLTKEGDPATYPLRWPTPVGEPRTPLRRTNSLWNNG